MKKHGLFFALLSLLLLSSCHKQQKIKRMFHINDFHNFSRTFNDLNEKQLQAAHLIGISPIASREEAEKKLDKLKEVKDCDLYNVDSLTNSVPFLVNKAACLLDTIGTNFQDSLGKKNAPKYKLIITSILRTHDDIKKLHQKNGNSTLNSAHLFGTTVDVAYTRYEKLDPEHELTDVPEDKLKAVLAEVLRDLQKGGKCYVRYEVKQGCFHITARP
ncbi:DUF5715 family protein [Parabacteroides sp. FAFU027]|uniref:DUF5715 family protein n=1 Tax=Parabacteroides sp. FAFU027 TaxID=2922715 RepID=UPI001FAEE939|nr:DUF5715 family protein [Parabacteroides sp. FAFU027]